MLRQRIDPPGSLNPWSLLKADLLADDLFSWIVLSGTFPVGPTPRFGFAYTMASFSPETAAGLFGVSGLFTTLQEPDAASGSSAFAINTQPTTAGPWRSACRTVRSAVLRIRAVPGPGLCQG